MYARSLDGSQKGLDLWYEPCLFCPKQHSQAPNYLDPIHVRHLASAMVIHEQAVGVQASVECHGFELTSPQTGNCDDEFLEVDLDDFATKIGFQSFGLGLAGYSTLLADSRRDAHLLEKVVEKR